MKIALISIVVCVMLFSKAHSEMSISITGEKWAPYNNYISDKQNPGFMLEIVEQILHKKGISFSYKEIPWARAVRETKNGHYNALIGTGQENASELIYPQEPIGWAKYAFFVKQESNWKFSDITSLEHTNLGILKGLFYGDSLDLYIKENHQDSSLLTINHGLNYLERNLSMLEKGRINATIDDSMVVQFHLNKSNRENTIKQAGFLDEGYGVYIAFSPKFPHAKEYARIIEDGVRELRKSGDLAIILNNYGVKDWVEVLE